MRWSVRSEDDLSAVWDDCIEGVKELLLDRVFSSNKLNVIHEENFVSAKPLFQLNRLFLLDGGHDVVGELFAGDVGKSCLRVLTKDVVANGLHKMGFTDSNATIKE